MMTALVQELDGTDPIVIEDVQRVIVDDASNYMTIISPTGKLDVDMDEAEVRFSK